MAVMGTFFIEPETFEEYDPKEKRALGRKILEAAKKNLLVSPRCEPMNKLKNLLFYVETMTAEEYSRYREQGGAWKFVPANNWMSQRLVYEQSIVTAHYSEGV
jgi:hypothetical protein